MLIAEKGQSCSYHIASDGEYRTKLYEKLHEEVAELVDARNLDEMADVLEVLDAVMQAEGMARDEVARVKRKKFEERGGFTGRFILEES